MTQPITFSTPEGATMNVRQVGENKFECSQAVGGGKMGACLKTYSGEELEKQLIAGNYQLKPQLSEDKFEPTETANKPAKEGIFEKAKLKPGQSGMEYALNQPLAPFTNPTIFGRTYIDSGTLTTANWVDGGKYIKGVFTGDEELKKEGEKGLWNNAKIANPVLNLMS